MKGPASPVVANGNLLGLIQQGLNDEPLGDDEQNGEDDQANDRKQGKAMSRLFWRRAPQLCLESSKPLRILPAMMDYS